MTINRRGRSHQPPPVDDQPPPDSEIPVPTLPVAPARPQTSIRRRHLSQQQSQPHMQSQSQTQSLTRQEGRPPRGRLIHIDGRLAVDRSSPYVRPQAGTLAPSSTLSPAQRIPEPVMLPPASANRPMSSRQTSPSLSIQVPSSRSPTSLTPHSLPGTTPTSVPNPSSLAPHSSPGTTPPAAVPGPATGSPTLDDQEGLDDDEAPLEPPRDRHGRVVKIPISLDDKNK